MKYIVNLTEQEELDLRQMVMMPGFPALLKLLQIESLEAQSEAMDCKGNKEQRLLTLADAQATAKVVSKFTQRLAGYRELPKTEAPTTEDIITNLWN